MMKLIQYCTKASLYDGPFGGGAGWAAAGMGYVLVGERGELVVIDGGNTEDAEEFLVLLEKLAGGKPWVRRWIITHPHGDHYGALLAICREPALAERLRVEELVYRFPEEFRMTQGADCSGGIGDLKKISEVTGANVHIPCEGEDFETDGMKFTMLFTPEDCSTLHNPNELSLIFTIDMDGKRVLITGDAYRGTLQRTLDLHKTEIACDILQLPHHGLCDTGLVEFYRAAGAKTVLVPISRAGDRTMASDMYGDAPEANRFAQQMAEKVYKAFEGTAALEFDSSCAG